MGYPEAQYIIDEINGKIEVDVNTNLESLLLTSHAVILCRGVIGQTFTLTNENTGMVKQHTLNSSDTLDSEGFYREVRIYVPVGTWKVHTVVEGLGEANGEISATQVAYVYTFTYEILIQLAKYTANDTFTVPDDVDHVFIDAAGGGGSGGGGYEGGNEYYCSGGGGGGGADCIKRKRFFVTPKSTHDIRIGVGGAAVGSETDGKAGTATVIGSLVTLAGGAGGRGNYYEDGGAGGGSGGGNGGNGGPGNGSSYTAGSAGATSGVGTAGGAGGDVCFRGDGGGGGGGSLGKGGKGGGGSGPVVGEAGVEGGGGGGSFGYLTPSTTIRKKMISGKGGDGVVYIYKGVVVS